MLNIFTAAKRYMYLSRSKMSGGELGKYFLDNLKMDVDASTWNTNTNCVGHATNCPSAPITLNNRQYTPAYTVTLAGQPGNSTTLSRVRVDITWPPEQ
jgi:hypothetical protein